MAEELLREEIDEILIKLKANELLLIATDLQIVLKEDEKDNKRKLLRLVEQYIDDLENIETLKQAKESFAKYIPINKNDTSNEHADGETDKGDTSKEQNNDETKTNDAKNNASKEPCNKDGRKDGEKNNASGINLIPGFLGAQGLSGTSAFYKDFKIRGLIGEVHQKDKLSFISLQKQIEEGTEKGYPEKEIVNAVIRAFTPGLYLRNVLETTEGLTLEKLTKFLQSHYLERSTTDLCQHMTSLTQSQQESSIQFVYRAMSLRQKIILASKSPTAEVK